MLALGTDLLYNFIMIYNYHTHTFRCSHASGSERNYIERAIANGVKKMGFSDHAPFMHDDGYEAYYRVKVSAVKDYFDTLNALRDEYKDKIEIFIGFEIECYPAYYEKMVKFAIDAGAEYLILGQHHTDTDRPNDPNGEYFFYPFKQNDNKTQLTKFINNLILAVKSGYISYIAHPDCFNYVGDNNFYNKEYLRLLKACKKYNVPIEINLLGIRDKRHYPNHNFLKLAGKVGVNAVIGHDAHDEFNAYDETSVIIAKNLAKEYGINILENFNVKLLNKKDL